MPLPETSSKPNGQNAAKLEPDERRLISVIIRTKDRPMLLARALQSLSNQTYESLQTIIVNDGGNRQAVDRLIIESESAKIDIIHNPSSLGRGAAFNRGLDIAEGSLIACLDDDDTYHPDFCAKMEKKFSALVKKFDDIVGVICRSEEIYEDVSLAQNADPRHFKDYIRQTHRYQAWQYNNADEIVSPYFYFVGRHDFLPVQTLFRRDCLVAEGGFREDASVLEDKPLYFRLLLRGRVFVVNETLAYHHNRNRKDTSPVSNTMFNKHYNWGYEFARFHADPHYCIDRSSSDISLRETLIPLFREHSLHLLWELRGEHVPSRQRVRIDWKDAEREVLPYVIRTYKWQFLAMGFVIFSAFALISVLVNLLV